MKSQQKSSESSVVIGGVCYIVTGGKIYLKCKNCGKLVRINKPILGSLHICEDTQNQQQNQQQNQPQAHRVVTDE